MCPWSIGMVLGIIIVVSECHSEFYRLDLEIMFGTEREEMVHRGVQTVFFWRSVFFPSVTHLFSLYHENIQRQSASKRCAAPMPCGAGSSIYNVNQCKSTQLNQKSACSILKCSKNMTNQRICSIYFFEPQ